jgi:hypothetical protein
VPSEVGSPALNRIEPSRSGRALRRMMLAHRDGGKVFSGTFMDEEGLTGEHPLRRSIESGLDARRAVMALFTPPVARRGMSLPDQRHPSSGARWVSTLSMMWAL